MSDVVYIVKPGDDNEELRYSLRSLTNWPHDNVWIVGHKPAWVSGVKHLPTEQLPGPENKHPNSIRNQLAAVGCDEVSDPFWIFNDDFFVVRPFLAPSQFTRGYVSDVLTKDGPTMGATFRRSMEATERICHQLGYAKPISYQAHTPLLVHKAAYKAAMAHNEPGVWVQHATIYGNSIGLQGIPLARDVKVYRSTDPILPWVEESPLLSTVDQAFKAGWVGRHIRRRFKEPSPYEHHR